MKAPIAQSGALPGNAQSCAIGAFIGLNGQKNIQNNSDCRFGLILTVTGNSNSNMMLKIKF
jgi:hypothetical protein